MKGLLCARLDAKSFPCIISWRLHNNPRDMKCQEPQLQMTRPRLREVKRLAQGQTADKRPDQDSGCKAHAPEIAATHKSKSKESSDLGRIWTSLGGTQICGSLLPASTKATSENICRRPESQQRKPNGQLPAGDALGCVHRLQKRGCRNLTHLAHSPGRQ